MKTSIIKHGYLITLMIMLFLVLGLSRGEKVSATSTATPTPTPIPASDNYMFHIAAQDYAPKSEVPIVGPTTKLYIADKGGYTTDISAVEWTTSNDEVITIVDDTTSSDPLMMNIVRNGPGYASITARVTLKDNTKFYVNIVVKVLLAINYDKDKTPTLVQATTSEEDKVLYLPFKDSDGDGSMDDTTLQKIYLKYANSSAFDNNELVGWSSSKPEVATVDDKGVVTPVGSGTTTITITTNTSYNGNYQTLTIIVVVNPTAIDPTTLAYEDNFTIQDNTTDYVIKSNAGLATNLAWVLEDSSGNTIDSKNSKLLKYSVSAENGDLVISKAKAGKYKIYAYAQVNGKICSTANIDRLEVTLIVDVKLTYPTNNKLIMNVGDTYSIINNSNIPSVDKLMYQIITGSSSIVTYNAASGLFTANGTGIYEIKFTNKMYSDGVLPENFTLTIEVIDGISLSMTSATISEGGILPLIPNYTNVNASISWTSKDTSVATVDNGVVTGVKAGVTDIIVSQTIQGITKTAKCTITVQSSVTKITIKPSDVNYNVGDFGILYAEVEPSSLNNVSLTWRSTDTSVVTITKSDALSATINAIGGGTAIIMAINPQNIIVGYCKVTVNIDVTGITLSETSVTATAATANLKLKATIAPDTATDKTVTWTSTNASVATVTSSGEVDFIAPGVAYIIATSTSNPTITAMCSITVTTPITSITLDDTTKTMYVGESGKLTFTVVPANATAQTLTWSSSNTAVATVSSAGLVTAVAAGTATITIKNSDGTITKTCVITVIQKVMGLTIDVTSLALTVGQTYTIKATVLPTNSTQTGITWTSSDATVATVDSSGKVTAVAIGKTVIVAKSENGSTVYCNVTVTQAVTGLKLNYTEKTVVIGDTFKIKATVLPSSATTISVSWSTSKSKVATVTSAGVVKGLSNGVAIITCKTDDKDYTQTCIVQVIEPVTSIKLSKKSYKLGIYKNFTIKATIKSNSATNPKLQWVSSNKNIASVSSKGIVTAKRIGYVTIIAKALDNSGEVASCEVRIVRGVTSVSVNRSSVTTVVGRTFALKATVKPRNATYKSVNWSSSDEAIALVDTDGVVTALATGKVLITATAKDSSGKKDTCYVLVRDITPATSVIITNKSLTMVVGETATLLKAIAPANTTDRYTWESDNRMVATVDSTTGKVYAREPGTANITIVTESGKTATAVITVVGLNATNLVLEQYSTYQLQVLGTTTGVTWDVADSEVALVTSGLVQSRRIGTTTITATVNGRKMTCKLKVVKIK